MTYVQLSPNCGLDNFISIHFFSLYKKPILKQVDDCTYSTIALPCIKSSLVIGVRSNVISKLIISFLFSFPFLCVCFLFFLPLLSPLCFHCLFVCAASVGMGDEFIVVHPSRSAYSIHTSSPFKRALRMCSGAHYSKSKYKTRQKL